VSYPALKQWIYKGKIKTVKTPGGHHRIRKQKLTACCPPCPNAVRCKRAEKVFRTISGRNQLVGTRG